MSTSLSELDALYRQNSDENSLYYEKPDRLLAAIHEELNETEEVDFLAGFVGDWERNVHMVRKQRSTILAVTTERVIVITPTPLMANAVRLAVGEGSEPFFIAAVPHNELSHVSGRRTAMSLGWSRELRLHYKTGKVEKILGLDTERSKRAEAMIFSAIARRERSGRD